MVSSIAKGYNVTPKNVQDKLSAELTKTLEAFLSSESPEHLVLCYKESDLKGVDELIPVTPSKDKIDTKCI
jgi:hypothetical protein